MIITPSQIKQMYNEGKPAISWPVHRWKLDEGDYASDIEYSAGTDGNLDSPVSTFNQDSCFIPIGTAQEFISMHVQIGDRRWNINEANAVGPNKTINAHVTGSTYGSVKLTEASNWQYFVDAQYNGMQRIWLPKSANSDKLGGYFNFHYHYDAWYTAFNGLSASTYAVVITLDGSVYKGSVSATNLVVTANGTVGPAGGGSSVPIDAEVVDIGTNSINGISKGSLVAQDGYKGKCYYFDADSGHVLCGTDSAFDITGGITLCGWVKPVYQPGTSEVAGIIEYAYSTSIYNYGLLFHSTTGNIYLQWFNGAWKQAIKNSAVDWGVWQYIAATWNGTNAKLYKNGIQLTPLDTDTGNAPMIANALNELRVGRYNVGVNAGTVKGWLQDVRIYDKALTQTRLRDIFNSTEKYYT